MGESSYTYSCKECGKKFYRKDMLRAHQVREKHFPPTTEIQREEDKKAQVHINDSLEIPEMGNQLENDEMNDI